MQVVFTAFHRQFGVVVRRAVFGETVAVVQFEVLEKSRFGNLLPVGLVVLPQHRQPRQFFLRLPRHQGTEQENGKEESNNFITHVECKFETDNLSLMAKLVCSGAAFHDICHPPE